MAWTKPVAATQTWGGAASSTVTYRGMTPAASPWVTVSAQPEAADGGIDFEVRFRETYPAFAFRGERPVLFQSSLSEGQP